MSRRVNREAVTFFLAAAIELLVLVVLAGTSPEKTAELAVPIGIIVCGLAGPLIAQSATGAAISGAALGVINTIMLLILGVTDKFAPSVRWAVSLAFCSAVASATWMVGKFLTSRPKS
jgi:hypothetical protein